MFKVSYKNKKGQNTIARNRIKKLFVLAEEKALSGNFTLANRYVNIARRISMRNLVPIQKEFKRKFCKHCYSFLLPDINCRIRLRDKKIIIYCKTCNRFTRFPIKNS